MNRIYQGRVTQIETKDNGGSYEAVAFGWDQSTCPLWKHHCVFQAAVNYYLLALASLAKESVPNADRLMNDLPKRIAESWERFPKSDAREAGAKSLRDSVAPWIGLDKGASLEQAAAAILEGNLSSGRTLSFALALILEECSGDSGIQQGGREYLPKLCDSESKASYSFSASSMASEQGKERLSAVLYGESTEAELKAIASVMDLSWTVKVSPGEFHMGEKAVDRLKEAISHLEEMLKKPSPRLMTFLDGTADPLAQIQEMKEMAQSMPEGFKIPKNRKAAPALTFASIAFMAFPSRLTGACLKLGVKAPAKSAASRKPEGVDFGSLGDDPVRVSRGERGYVFRAFTALPQWRPLSPGKPTWKEFDIAAFKEALKALNQFSLKTDERERRKKDLEGLIAFRIGTPIKGWNPSSVESGEADDLPEPMDPSLLRLGFELEEEMTRGLSESIVGEISTLTFGAGAVPMREGGWTVTRASLRGLREIIPEWKKLLSKQGAETPTTQLADVVKKHQGREGKAAAIGSVGLFLTLCEPRFRPLWQDTHYEEEEENRFLHSFADLHEEIEDYLRCEEAINLTPAEPRYSRRLFMFSDLTGRSAVKYQDLDRVEVSMAVAEDCVREKRFLLRFAAPRLRRDGLLGSEEGWLQPVTKALALNLPKHEPSQFYSAVSLMPDFDERGTPRYLLNFAANIDAEPIRQALGKATLWERQFNGTKDKRIHLHWPGTADREKMKSQPWWENSLLLKNGFTVLATDLGQRTAGAWALLRITSFRPVTTRPVRSIGQDGQHEWFGEIVKNGIYRLPGEDAMVRGKDGEMREEFSGKRGRNASEDEWRAALALAKDLSAEDPTQWVGAAPTKKSHPEQNDSLIALANRRLSRLGTFHRWSCFDPDKEKDPLRKASLLEKLSAELAHWESSEVKEWASKLAVGDVDAFRNAAGSAFATYRSLLLPILIRLAERVTPLRDHQWAWKNRGNGAPYGELIRVPKDADTKSPLRGQRGLSMARIEQLENLRRLFLRYNRALDRESGAPAKFGRADAGRASGEPCRDLLRKIDRIKEQRVNQTAHLILAQALGVKLSPHSTSSEVREAGDYHGEYTQIPGRQPVDLVVLEDLGRYLSSQGRAPSENSRLMKWSHRAVLDKVKMLVEEPFGIPVVEVPAAYSSRFNAVTGEPGARCEERAELDDYLKDLLKRRAETTPAQGQPDLRKESRRLLEQFETLEVINAHRRVSGEKAPATLLLPKLGGPLFLGSKESAVVQSDMNAAVNLAFRAVAAPEALHLLHRVRTQYQNGGFNTVAKNAREKAAFGKKGAPILLKGTVSAKLSASPNFFYDSTRTASFDNGEVTIGSDIIPLASGIGIWRAVNEKILPRIVKLNEDRLDTLRSLKGSVTDLEDQIPM